MKTLPSRPGLTHPLTCFTRAFSPARIAGLALITCAAIASQASAAISVQYGSPSSVKFSFDTKNELSNPTEPGGDAPWVVVTFTDSLVHDNRVTAAFEVPNGGLADTEFLTSFFFNYNPLLTTDGGSFALDPKRSAIRPGEYEAGVGNFSYGVDSTKGGGKFSFDLLIAFFKNQGEGRLTDGEKVEFDIIYTPLVGNAETFESTDFLYQSIGKNASLGPYAQAHMQGIANGQGSLWVNPGIATTSLISVPEPGSFVPVLALISCGLLLRSRRTPAA